MKLARWLRQRYPKALIIFLDMWTPQHYHSESGKYRYITEDVNHEEDWVYDPAQIYSSAHLEEMKSVSISLHVWAHRRDDAHKNIAQDGQNYSWDGIHYSKQGQAYIARLIQHNLRIIGFRTHHEGTVNQWKRMDMCESWHDTGHTKLVHDENLVMAAFKEGKYALETRERTWLSLENHHSVPMTLHVEFMTTSPDCLVPPTRLSIDGHDSSTATVVTDCPSKGFFKHPVHIPRSIRVGLLSPGGSTLLIEPLARAEWPFRVTGIKLLQPSEVAVAEKK